MGGANGISIAVLHTNSTDRLVPLNGMVLAATDYMQPLGEGLTTFWEWIPTPSPLPPTTMEESPPSPMNTTTTTDATTTTAADTNATTATEEEWQA